jgi:hypothetical protein
MAMNYQNFASLGVNLNRQKYGPLDISNVFTSAADLKYYLTKGTFTEGVSEYWYKNANEKVVPYPYEGQVLATVIDGVVNVYALSLDAEGNFQTQEIAGKIEVDGNTIKLNAGGKLELVGMENLEAGKTYVPSLVNGVLTWAEPDTSTAEGQQAAISALEVRAKTLEDTVNGKAAVGEEGAEGYVPAVKGLAEKVADEVAAREAADSALEGKIAEALQAAKDYADQNDADTKYDDTALAGRVETIEKDYLKAADKYDDSELIAAIEELDTAIGDENNGLVKDVAANTQAIADEKTRAEAAEKALGERIDAIDFVDPTELADAIKDFATKSYVDGEIDTLEAAIAALNHFKAEVVDSIDKVTEDGVLYLIKDESVAGVDKYNEYIVVGGVATLIGDTTTDLSNYYNKTEIDGKVEVINKAISDEVGAREALAEKVTALENVDNATQAELETYKAEVTAAIATAKSEAIADADGKLANKLDTAIFTEFQGTNTTAIATAKQEAIDAAAEAEEAKGYAVATEVAGTYATKAELEAHEAASESTYAKIETVNTELAKKVESATIAHAVAADPDNGIEAIPEGVTKEGTTLKIVVDAPTRAETTQMIADKVAAVTGGESAAAVKLLVEAEIERSTAKDEAHENILAKLTGEATVAGSVAEAKALAQKGVDDAAKVAGDLATANLTIADNTREIGVVKSSINTLNNTLTEKVTALENKDAGFDSAIAALQTTVSGEGGHASRITALEGNITTLTAKDTELAGKIDTKANAADVYTKGEVDTLVSTAVGNVDLTPYAKTADVNVTVETINASIATKADASAVYTKEEANAEFMTQTEVDDRINALIVAADPEGGKTIENIQNLVTYVDENAGEIAELITTVGGHTTTIAEHTQKLSEIDAAVVALVQPKASEEISVATDGTLGIIGVNVNKLVQTEGDILVLNGGAAN